jgi:hypothetical protein
MESLLGERQYVIPLHEQMRLGSVPKRLRSDCIAVEFDIWEIEVAPG